MASRQQVGIQKELLPVFTISQSNLHKSYLLPGDTKINPYLSVSATVSMLLLVAVCACNKDVDKRLVEHFNENIFVKANQYREKVSAVAATQYVDSVYQTFPAISVADKCRYYKYLRSLDGGNSTDNAFAGKGMLYIDSIIHLIEENDLSEKMSKEYGIAFKMKGELFFYNGKHKDAIQAISFCKYITRQNGDSCTMGENTALLALISYKQRKYPDAITYYKEAISCIHHCTDGSYKFYLMQGNLDNLGLSYAEMGQSDSAKKYFEKTIDYIKANINQYPGEPKFPYEALYTAYRNLGDLYTEKGDYKMTEEILRQCATINTTHLEDEAVHETINVRLAEVYQLTGRPQQAESLLLAASKSLSKLNTNSNLIWTKLMWEITAMKGNPALAMKYMEQYYVLKDSMTLKEAPILATNPQTEYEKIEEGYRLKFLEKNSRLQSMYFEATLIITALLTLLAAVIFFNFRRSKRMYKRELLLNIALEKSKLELKELMAEKERLKEQEIKRELQLQETKLQAVHQEAIIMQRRRISNDMHDDLSSSLTALRYFVEDVQKRQSEPGFKEIFGEISAEVDAIYKNARQYMHNLNSGMADDKPDVVAFLYGIRTKFAEKKLLHIELFLDETGIQDKLSPHQHNQLYHIVKEGLSNIVKHAHASKAGVSIQFADGNCAFAIWDEGIGFKEEILNEGLGQNSIRSRVETLAGTVVFASAASGTTITGNFPTLS
ncbi:MAG: ATP-binding protein [Bacteroidota bacterium]